jgi:hypothetical protein
MQPTPSETSSSFLMLPSGLLASSVIRPFKSYNARRERRQIDNGDFMTGSDIDMAQHRQSVGIINRLRQIKYEQRC